MNLTAEQIRSRALALTDWLLDRGIQDLAELQTLDAEIAKDMPGDTDVRRVCNWFITGNPVSLERMVSPRGPVNFFRPLKP